MEKGAERRQLFHVRNYELHHVKKWSAGVWPRCDRGACHQVESCRFHLFRHSVLQFLSGFNMVAPRFASLESAFQLPWKKLCGSSESESGKKPLNRSNLSNLSTCTGSTGCSGSRYLPVVVRGGGKIAACWQLFTVITGTGSPRKQDYRSDSHVRSSTRGRYWHDHRISNPTTGT